jgi:hypothetical protein
MRKKKRIEQTLALRTVTDAELRLIAGGTIWKVQGPGDAQLVQALKEWGAATPQ